MKEISNEQVQEKHDKLREILIRYDNPEYGDAIVDEISWLFGFPTTIDTEPEESIDFTYSFLRRKLDWEQFCDLTGIDLYAKANGYEIKDSEIFSIEESKAIKFNLL